MQDDIEDAIIQVVHSSSAFSFLMLVDEVFIDIQIVGFLLHKIYMRK